MKNKNIVIVVPVFEDVAFKELLWNLSEEYGSDCFVLAVDDGSVKTRVEKSWFNASKVDGCIVRLARNVGHQSAISVGINFAVENFTWNFLIIMDSDGEDTPKSSRELLSCLENGDTDFAVATRRSRVESFKFRLFYQIYKIIFYALVGRTISSGNFMAMTPRAAETIAKNPDIWQHVSASVLNTKMRVGECAIDRGPRYAGESKMNFVSLVLHGFKGIMVFFDQVLVRISIFCCAVASITVLAMIVIAALKIVGLASPGWFSTVWGILTLILFQILIIGLISMFIVGSKRTSLINNFDYKKLIDSVSYIYESEKNNDQLNKHDSI